MGGFPDVWTAGFCASGLRLLDFWISDFCGLWFTLVSDFGLEGNLADEVWGRPGAAVLWEPGATTLILPIDRESRNNSKQRSVMDIPYPQG